MIDVKATDLSFWSKSVKELGLKNAELMRHT